MAGRVAGRVGNEEEIRTRRSRRREDKREYISSHKSAICGQGAVARKKSSRGEFSSKKNLSLSSTFIHDIMTYIHTYIHTCK